MDTSMWNMKTKFLGLNKLQARQFQFIVANTNRQLGLISKLPSIDSFLETTLVAQTFFNDVGRVYDEFYKVSVYSWMQSWAKSVHQHVAPSSLRNYAEKVKKKSEFKKKLAEGISKLDGLSQESVLLPGLLEHGGFAHDKPVSADSTKVDGQLKRLPVSAFSALGALTSQSPVLQKKFNIEITDTNPKSTRPPARRDIKSKSSSSRRSRSRSQPSRSSQHSKASRTFRASSKPSMRSKKVIKVLHFLKFLFCKKPLIFYQIQQGPISFILKKFTCKNSYSFS